jgi:HNH endonuclease
MDNRPYISQDLRRLVKERADCLCEYCLIHESDTALGCAVDHVISIKHGGATDADNLAYACVFCNRYKGSDIGSIIWATREFTRFHNPRCDRWATHFQLQHATIQPLSNIGEATARILGFNDQSRVLERLFLIERSQYPHPSAVKRIQT